MVSTLVSDLRVAVRSAFRQPGFTAVVIGTLALGIGSTTAMFAIIHAALLKPLPYQDPGRLVLARRTVDADVMMWSSAPDYYDYRAQTDAFQALAAAASGATKVTVTGGERPERIAATRVSHDLFRTLGVAPVAGRWFTIEEGKAGAPFVVMISDRLARRRFGDAQTAVGRTLALAGVAPQGVSATIVGVMPATYRFLDEVDLWAAIREGENDGPITRQFHNWVLVARLKPGVSIEGAQGQVDVILEAAAAALPGDEQAEGPPPRPAPGGPVRASDSPARAADGGRRIRPAHRVRQRSGASARARGHTAFRVGRAIGPGRIPRAHRPPVADREPPAGPRVGSRRHGARGLAPTAAPDRDGAGRQRRGSHRRGVAGDVLRPGCVGGHGSAVRHRARRARLVAPTRRASRTRHARNRLQGRHTAAGPAGCRASRGVADPADRRGAADPEPRAPDPHRPRFRQPARVDRPDPAPIRGNRSAPPVLRRVARRTGSDTGCDRGRVHEPRAHSRYRRGPAHVGRGPPSSRLVSRADRGHAGRAARLPRGTPYSARGRA